MIIIVHHSYIIGINITIHININTIILYNIIIIITIITGSLSADL